MCSGKRGGAGGSEGYICTLKPKWGKLLTGRGRWSEGAKVGGEGVQAVGEGAGGGGGVTQQNPAVNKYFFNNTCWVARCSRPVKSLHNLAK
jgi:hypothetical protein